MEFEKDTIHHRMRTPLATQHAHGAAPRQPDTTTIAKRSATLSCSLSLITNYHDTTAPTPTSIPCCCHAQCWGGRRWLARGCQRQHGLDSAELQVFLSAAGGCHVQRYGSVCRLHCHTTTSDCLCSSVCRALWTSRGGWIPGGGSRYGIVVTNARTNCRCTHHGG